IAMAAVALASGLAWFAFTTASMAGDLAALADPANIIAVLQIEFGRLWAARMALILLALVLAARESERRRPWALATVSALAAASLCGTGHAGEPGGAAGAIHRACDAVHLLAAGAWLGGLPALLLALRDGREGAAQGADPRFMLLRFSLIGVVSVAAILATGIVNTLDLAGSAAALISTVWGRLLIAKICLVLVMVALALDNRLRLTPRLELHKLARNIIFEQVLALAVLALVAVLGTLAPGAEMAMAPSL
ncbi:MAG: copper homeostasis membrane protein CopD, partial [Caulobacteraceae bacterium]